MAKICIAVGVSCLELRRRMHAKKPHLGAQQCPESFLGDFPLIMKNKSGIATVKRGLGWQGEDTNLLVMFL